MVNLASIFLLVLGMSRHCVSYSSYAGCADSEETVIVFFCNVLCFRFYLKCV